MSVPLLFELAQDRAASVRAVAGPRWPTGLAMAGTVKRPGGISPALSATPRISSARQ